MCGPFNGFELGDMAIGVLNAVCHRRFAALPLMVPLAATSTDAMMRRLDPALAAAASPGLPGVRGCTAALLVAQVGQEHVRRTGDLFGRGAVAAELAWRVWLRRAGAAVQRERQPLQRVKRFNRFAFATG